MNPIYINDPYLSTQECVARLYQWYKQHKTLIIAFDYDDTVYDFHNKGYKYERVINLLIECQNLNFILILFTGHEIEEANKIAWDLLINHGIKTNYINESPVMNTKKPYFNLLLDDKAGLGQSVDILEKVIKKIWKKEF